MSEESHDRKWTGNENNTAQPKIPINNGQKAHEITRLVPATSNQWLVKSSRREVDHPWDIDDADRHRKDEYIGKYPKSEVIAKQENQEPR
jgi:hypothetical protein